MTAYLKVFTAAFVGLLLVALLNLVVDPYGIYNLVSLEGVNTTRPVMQNHEKLVKSGFGGLSTSPKLFRPALLKAASCGSSLQDASLQGQLTK